VAFLCHSAWLLWLLGYPDRALQSNSEALSLARELSHPHSLSWAHLYAALVHANRREWPAAQEQAEALIALSSEQGFAYRLAQGRILQGWALVQQGQGEGVIEQMKKNLAFVRATGAAVYMPYFRTLIAETYGCIGRPEEGVTELSEVLTLIDKTGERFYEATVYRAQGEWLLKLADDRQAEAEACFQQALTSARQQQAKSLELEAAISLSQLWQRQGRGAEAYPILAEIYGWFTEGFDIDMLQRAKTLLDQLA
jgi:predicted ATPase